MFTDQKQIRINAMSYTVEGCEKPNKQKADSKPCAAPDCSKDAHAKGYCYTHYCRIKKNGTLELKHRPRVECCVVDGCENTRQAGNLCGMHFARLKRSGKTDERPVRGCSVDGCVKKHHGGGYCNAHRKRLDRHGDPLRGKMSPGAGQEFLEANIGHSFGCLEWPLSRNPQGYGVSGLRGKRVQAHRAMCIFAHGDPPFDGAEAAHKCGNPWCVAPLHLRWSTPAENGADKSLHGTLPIGEKHWQAKITSEQAVAIFKDDRLWTEIAKAHDVSLGIVGHIKQGNTWSHATGYYGRRAAP
jgi:hypothetical protein